MSFTPINMSPLYYQTYEDPSKNENIPMDNYLGSTLIYTWNRATNKVFWLQYVDQETSEQTWTLFPDNTPDINFIGILPELQRLYVMVSYDSDPVSSINSPTLFNGEYGLTWWNRGTGEFFKLISYTAEGTNLVWESIIPPLGILK